MELNTKGTGKMTYNMEMELKPGQMVLDTKGVIKMVKSMEKGHICGVMGHSMWENGLIIK
jgi:hypothetical protein